MHSKFSSDSKTSMEAMIEQAAAIRLESICFTDHMDYDYPIFDINEPLDFLFDPKEYTETIARLKERYQNKIKIYTGIELGLKSGIDSKVKQLLNCYDFDFIIGSSHLLYNEDPYYECFWSNLRKDSSYTVERSLDETIVQKAIGDYFNSILTNLELFPDFQIYGHLDYIVRYAPEKDTYYHVQDYLDVIDTILKRLIETGRGIELNTSGLKSGLHYANPHLDILKRYRALGGEIITVGADAHTPDYIGYKFDKAREFLLQAGFQYYTTFSKQKPIFHPL